MGDSGTNDTRVRAYRVTRADYPGTSCTYRDAQTAIDAEFDGAEVGDKVTIEMIEMTEDEFDNLPEFEGW
jgi:hypothetical protein